MTDEQIRQDIQMIFAQQEKRIAKYRRNFNRYANNGQRTEDIREQYSNPLAYWNTAAGEDTGVIPSLNVIKSCVDTHVSKLAQTKVRPFFNPIVGTFETRKTCRQAQIYFDEFFDSQKVYPKASLILKYADIFECGHLWADDESKSIKTVGPWEWYIDAAEYYFGKLSRGFLRFHQYPLIFLKDKLKPGDWKNKLQETPWLKVTYYVYFDLLGKRRVELFGDSGEIFHTKKIDYDVPPVVSLYREKPLKGAFSTSMADDVYTIQRQIDTLCHRISVATELSPANAIFLPKGSDLKASVITNEIGMMYEFTPTPTEGGGRPIVSTPRPIDPMYTQLLEMWIEKAYNVTGVSQLSAQVKKPKGLNSGVALQTVEDVESERHQVSLQDYIQLFKDLAETCIAVFPEGEDILPSQTGRAKIKWGEIKRQRKAFSIQFSASSSLSKDPQTKMEQIEKLIDMGVINPDLAASLLEFPDLENAYSITASSYDECQRIIERAIEDQNYDFPDVANIKQLFAESVNTLLRLDANDEKPEVLKRLAKLIGIVKMRMDEIAKFNAPPPIPPPVPPLPPVLPPGMAPGMPPGLPPGVPPGMPPMPPAPLGPPPPAPGPVETGVAMAGPPPGAVM